MQQQQCVAKCSFVYDTFSSGCGVGAGTAQARCRNMGTAPLLDPATQQPLDAGNPHMQAQIDALGLAYRPPSGPLMVCPDHYGLVERNKSWNTALKVGAAGAAGAAGLALRAAYKKATAQKQTAQQELRQSLRDALVQKRDEKYRELLQKLEEVPMDDPYWDKHPDEKAFLVRMMQSEDFRQKEEDQEAHVQGKIDNIMEVLLQEREHRLQDEFEKAQDKWELLTYEQQKECEAPCDYISPDERKILIQRWKQDNPPRWRGLDSPHWTERARTRAAAAGRSIAATAAHTAKAVTNFATEAWSHLDAEAFFQKIRDAAAQVSRVLNTSIQSDMASKATYQEMARLTFPASPSSQGAIVELLELLHQKDQYVYSLSTLAMMEAIEANRQTASTKWGIALPSWLDSAPSRRGTLVMECLDKLQSDENKRECVETHLTQKLSRYGGLRTQTVPILSRDGQFKAPNFTPELGWMFDMQSDADVKLQENNPVPRVDATWMDVVGEALRQINRGDRDGSIHERLNLLRKAMEREQEYSYQEMTQAPPRGIPQLDDPKQNPFLGSILRGWRGYNIQSQIFENTQRYKQEITDQYRQNHNRRSQWLQRMIFLIDVILPKLTKSSFRTKEESDIFTRQYLQAPTPAYKG